MAKKIKEKNPDKLGFGRLLAFKSSDVSAAWINVIMLSYLTIYASDTLGINVGVVGGLLLVSRVFDGFTDIFAGWLIDNTHTKWGKGRPYDLCIVGMTLCTVLLFSASPAWSYVFKCVWIVLMYTLTFSVFSTLRTTANNPYTIRHFSNNSTLLRKVASLGGMVTMAGSMVVSILFPRLIASMATTASGWTLVVAIIMIPATLIGLLRFFFCKEDPAVDEGKEQERVSIKEIFTMLRRNKYAWVYAIIMLCYNIITNLAVASYYFKWIIGDIGIAGMLSIVGIVLLPLMAIFPKIMKKVGSMGKMITYFCGIGIVGYMIAFFSGSFLPGVLAGYVMGTFATLPLAYYGVLFIMNICTYNEMIGLPRMDGSSGILAGFCAKVGAALGSGITGLLLMLAGYVSGESVTAQPDSALLMIRADFTIVPAILLVVIAVCTLVFSRLEKDAAEFEAAKKVATEIPAKE